MFTNSPTRTPVAYNISSNNLSLRPVGVDKSGTLNNSSNSLYSKYLGNFFSFLGPLTNEKTLFVTNPSLARYL